jgi:phosphoribosylaminoimidazolecarboxamide formyltransferase/IMP cyclohydrolase
MDAAWNMVVQFERPAVAIIKHANPCGAALGKDVKEAYIRALEGDPISAYGSIVASNKPVTKDAALEMKKLFIEVLIAPDFEPEALEILERKKNIRLIKMLKWAKTGYDVKRVNGGLLIQDWDTKKITEVNCVSNRIPTEKEMQDLLFAWAMVRFVKSNAIVFAKDEMLVGVGAGQMSRVDAVKIAAMKAGDRAKGAVMASDAFFPFRDAIDEAHNAGITAVIQPGGSKRDKEVIEAVNEHNMAMVFTGFRVFLH